MEKVVLFCSEYITCLGVIRCLGEAGYRPEVYCYGENEDYILKSKYVSQGKQFKTAEDVVSFLINDYPTLPEKPILFTIPDPPAYFVDLNQKKLRDKFILMSAGRDGQIGFWMNKKNIARLAEKHGLKIPWIRELSKDDVIPDDLEYPVFTKSIKTADGGKCDESICYSKCELEERKKTLHAKRFVVMKYIEKVKEVNYFGIAIKGHVYINFIDERSRFPKGAYGHYNIFKECPQDDVYKKIKAMILETGYEGLFDAEFLQDADENLYFMEVNFRVDGAVYKLSPGINLLDEWCKLVKMTSSELPDSLPIKKKKFVGMTEVDDFKVSVLGGLVNPFVWLYQFITADKHMLLNFKDPKPAITRVLNEVKKHF